MYAFVNAAAALRPSAFAGRAVSTAAPPCVATVSMAMSKSVPFWEAPPKLDGRPGDAGFDPLGFSNMFDLGTFARLLNDGSGSLKKGR